MNEQEQIAAEHKRVSRAAILISIGNIASRALGLVRDMAKGFFFGAGGAVSAFDVANQIPTMFFDQLAGGMLSSSLVPVFSELADKEDKSELWELFSAVLCLASILLGAIVILMEIFAPWAARALGYGLDLNLTTQMIRITSVAVFFINIAGLFTAVLYAMGKFVLPAFNAAVYNLTMVIVMLILGRSNLGAQTLAIGVLAATTVQAFYLSFGLRHARLWKIKPRLWHPAMKQIGKLYLPIGLGLLVDMLARGIGYNIASRTGENGIAWMNFANPLIQFPLGLVVTAISVAILPTLSRYAAEENETAFRSTLAKGIRMVLILIIPAAAGMLLLAEPLVAVVLQRGEFLPSDTLATADALRYNILGLVFTALDTPLIYAFYARKNTWTPALVGMGTAIFYIAIAVIPLQWREPLLGPLILANSIKLTAHALVMLYLFNRKVGSLKDYHVWRTTLISIVASVIMILPTYWVLNALESSVPEGSLGYLIRLAAAGLTGAGVYLVLLRLVGVEEITLIREALRRKANAPESGEKENV